MKSCLLGLLLIAAASLPADAGTVRFSLAPVPFYVAVPEETLLRLSAEPLNGGWAEEVKGAGATEAVLVQYQPAEGERIILFSAYCFPADVWDAAQKPDEPPPFGTEIIREDGMVLSAATPFDMIFKPETPDGRNVAKLMHLIGKATSYTPAR